MMLLLLTDDTWSRAVRSAGWVLAGWVALSVPTSLAVGAFMRAGRGDDCEED